MYIEFDGDRYEAETDINGSRNQLSRYNKNRGIRISLCFTDTAPPTLLEEVKNDLKDIFISKIRTVASKN